MTAGNWKSLTVACLKLAGSLQLIVGKMPADWWTWMSLIVEMIVGRIVVVGQIFALIVVVRLVVVAQPSAIAVAAAVAVANVPDVAEMMEERTMLVELHLDLYLLFRV